MSARRLRAATDRAQTDWAATVSKVSAHHAKQIAQIADRDQAHIALVALLRREAPNARAIGASLISGIVTAAGARSDRIIPTAGVGPPIELHDRMVTDWTAAELSRLDPATFREGRVRRTIDQSLQHAFDLGVTDALHGETRVIGYRRVSRAGCCGACLALIDGATIQTTRPFPRHRYCRCFMEPVISGVNTDASGRPTGQERWDHMNAAEQDRMFLHHGGAQKADLLRRGDIQLPDLIAHQPRRDDSTPLPEETSLSALEAIATARHLVARGHLPDGILQMPANLRPTEWDALLRERLGGWAEIARADGSIRPRPPTGESDRLWNRPRSPLGFRVAVWGSRVGHAHRVNPGDPPPDRPEPESMRLTLVRPDLIVSDPDLPQSRQIHARREGARWVLAVIDVGPDGLPWLVTAWYRTKLQRRLRERQRIWSP